MHDRAAEGNEFFKCDFCRRPWREDRPMVEGHQGSLVCGDCLTTAFTEIVLAKAQAVVRTQHEKCRMCLEQRQEPHWRSPLHDDAVICRRCIRQSAQAMSKDPESGWKRPGAPAAAEDEADE